MEIIKAIYWEKVGGGRKRLKRRWPLHEITKEARTQGMRNLISKKIHVATRKTKNVHKHARTRTLHTYEYSVVRTLHVRVR